MLWIALHLPRLPLASWLAMLPPAQRAQPAALIDARTVLMCNAAAQQLGVQPGLPRVTALALVPQLQCGSADPQRDRQTLRSVAHMALAFTPSVCLVPGAVGAVLSHTVLLEVQSSLRCFGGWVSLLQRLRTALALLPCTVQLASAPTALGAAVLACGAEAGEVHAEDVSQLEGLLEAAPLWLLASGRAQWEMLDRMGLGTFGALCRQPRRALLRRVGPALLDEVDTVLGARCAPAPAWVTLPTEFDARLELQARADTTAQLLHGAQWLIGPLLAWARAQQARIRRCTLYLHHERRRWLHEAAGATGVPAATELPIALAEASCDEGHLSLLLRERLAQVSLPAPVLALRLHCADVVRGSPPSAELFASARVERQGVVQLIERLQARLGAGQVQQLQPVAHHLPEHTSRLGGVSIQSVGQASRAVSPARLQRSAASAAHGDERCKALAAGAPRPVWLLSEPQRLFERQSRPVLEGQPLQLLCGPERIEAGWWEGQSTGRDYFIAQTVDGALVWLYRARLPLAVPDSAQGWFVHGHFG